MQMYLKCFGFRFKVLECESPKNDFFACRFYKLWFFKNACFSCFGGKVNALILKKKLPPEGGRHRSTTIYVMQV